MQERATLEIVIPQETIVNLDFASVDSGFLGLTIASVTLACMQNVEYIMFLFQRFFYDIHTIYLIDICLYTFHSFIFKHHHNLLSILCL